MLITADELLDTAEEKVEALREEYGLDKPMIVQYENWVVGIFRGDLGKSIVRGTPVINDIIESLPITIQLGALAFILSVFLGIPLGVISAIRRGNSKCPR